MSYGIAAAATALLAASALTVLLRRVALRTGFTVRRIGSAGRRTPRLGGLAVATVTAAVTTVGASTGVAPLDSGALTLLIAAGAVAALGFLDDVRPVGARARVVVEAGAASFVVHAAQLGFLVGALAVLWIVFVTHACRLIDTSDGALGTVAVVTALGLSACAAAGGLGPLAALLGVLAAALTGFLMHNWHPARMRLGGCGALFTGFFLACAAVLVNAGHEALPGAGSLFAMTVVVTADAALVAVSRRRAGRTLFQGGADHIAHRLRRLGLTQTGVAVVLGVASLAGAVTALLLHDGTLGPSAALWLVCAAAGSVAGLLRVPVYGVRRRGHRPVRTAVVDVAR
ncbi:MULTISPECIES: MraY family glycosyltransferase [unclassified Streptomyces]|uniref:MraY family glycosyltransferase n=1 Tax=unclassified Streptomyces TaxID=2593676 RepID=UPI002E3542D9|nr:MraY family glycosyltransferase [Streptomyces sp. NBC_01280]